MGHSEGVASAFSSSPSNALSGKATSVSAPLSNSSTARQKTKDKSESKK
jgi:hypothetical protein